MECVGKVMHDCSVNAPNMSLTPPFPESERVSSENLEDTSSFFYGCSPRRAWKALTACLKGIGSLFREVPVTCFRDLLSMFSGVFAVFPGALAVCFRWFPQRAYSVSAMCFGIISNKVVKRVPRWDTSDSGVAAIGFPDCMRQFSVC